LLVGQSLKLQDFSGSISFVEDERRAATAPPYAQLEDLSQNEETGTSSQLETFLKKSKILL